KKALAEANSAVATSSGAERAAGQLARSRALVALRDWSSAEPSAHEAASGAPDVASEAMLLLGRMRLHASDSASAREAFGAVVVLARSGVRSDGPARRRAALSPGHPRGAMELVQRPGHRTASLAGRHR